MYHLSVFIHILSAMFWIGGMLFTAAVLVPASHHRLLKDRKGTLFTVIGKKFSRISWILFLILVVTGITNLLTRGYTIETLATSTFWNSHFGNTLSKKLYLFATVLIMSSIHDFYAGPKAAELMDEQPENFQTKRMQKLSRWLGRANLILGLAILYYAMQLIRG